MTEVNLGPAIEPTNHSPISLSYTASLLTFITGGIYLLFQGYRLKKALEMGRIEEARERMEKGGWLAYKHFITSDDIRSLALREIQSVQLIANQILFNPELANGGSSAALAFIVARDERTSRIESPPALLQILPYTKLAETVRSSRYAGVGDTEERTFANWNSNTGDDPIFRSYLEATLSECDTSQGLIAFINKVFKAYPDRGEAFSSYLQSFYEERTHQNLYRVVYAPPSNGQSGSC